jgi:hypothetical protein
MFRNSGFGDQCAKPTTVSHHEILTRIPNISVSASTWRQQNAELMLKRLASSQDSYRHAVPPVGAGASSGWQHSTLQH